jgi:hypothetical protein
MRADIAPAVRAPEGRALERVRWTVALGAAFREADLAHALAGFRRMYNVRPERVLCAPDVLTRVAVLCGRSAEDALHVNLHYEGVAVVSAILAPGTIVFEGAVDALRMGDW